MLRSMYAGISGMKNFQTKLDVIGNNIANVNTSGFKKGRVTFQDMMSQMTSGAQGPTATKGGVNPAQIGLGSQMGSIDNVHTQGFRQTTNRTLDFALEGDGMFVLQEGNSTLYTRAGNFYLDDVGNIVNPQGIYLMGYPSYQVPDETVFTTKDGAGNPLTISINESTRDITITSINRAGEEIETAVTYDENSPVNNKYPNVTILDQNDNDITFNFADNGYPIIETTENGKNVTKTFTDDGNGENTIDISVGTLTAEIKIKGDGTLRLLNDDETELDFTEDANGVMTATTTTAPNVTVTIDGNTINISDGAGNEITSSLMDEKLNMEDLIDYTETSSLNIPESAESFSVQPNGTITYIDEFGQTRIAGQVALANFSNPGGLEKAGSNLFLNSENAGYNGLVIPDTEGAASIVSGALEMSNVDLAEEFTEMITAQRGFQANTKIITTSDEILQELVNLKR